MLNLLLVRLGCPPIVILKQHRPQYLLAMHRADNGDYGPLGELLARATYDNLNCHPEDDVVEMEAQQDVRVEQRRADGTWRSSRKAVDASGRCGRTRSWLNCRTT